MSAQPTRAGAPPASDVSSAVGLVGLAALAAWIALCRNWAAIADAFALPGSREPLAGPYAALVAMVRKRVPESEVEDIVQATLTEAITSPNAPSESDALRRWIFGVAKNKVVDYPRRDALPHVGGDARDEALLGVERQGEEALGGHPPVVVEARLERHGRRPQ